MVGWLLTGGLIPLLLLLCGFFFLIYLKGYPFRAPRKLLRSMRGGTDADGISPFRAVMQALAGTLGVGNLVGVANAIALGGAGAMFWMWISALIAMILKYAEILLAVAHRRYGQNGERFGGAVYYIKDYFLSNRHVKTAFFVSSVFAGLMILNTFSMGCVIQVNAISSALSGVLSIPPLGCALLLVGGALPAFFRGSRGISAMTEYLVPMMTCGYVLMSVAVLFLRRDALGAAFDLIFEEAFQTKSMLSGVWGFGTSRALRVGTMRGLLSNEAGCGTAPTAHAAAAAKDPASQGIWGIFEVFVDTILLCTVTGLVILVSYGDVEMFADNSVMMVVRAYSTVLGGISEWFLCAAIFLFGYATLICWSGYGLENLRFLSSKKQWKKLYYIGLIGCILFGCFTAPSQVWMISDFAIASLTTINLIVLILMRKEIRKETMLWKDGLTV